MPPEVTARIAALLKAAQAPRGDARLTYFGALLDAAYPDPATRAAGLAAEYLRVMRFLYQKEFVAQRRPPPPPRSPSCIGVAASAPTPRSRPATSSISASAC